MYRVGGALSVTQVVKKLGSFVNTFNKDKMIMMSSYRDEGE